MTPEQRAVEDHVERARLEQRIAQLEAQLAERDAQCAAMREALESIDNFIGAAPAVLKFTSDDPQRIYEAGWNSAVADIANHLSPALASDAGKAVLERLEKAEKEARRFQQWLSSTAIVRETIERCAKVAESYEPHCESCPRGVVNAIRALATDPDVQLAEAKAVLKEVEWAHFVCECRPYRWCQACGEKGEGPDPGTHAPDCRLAKVLEGLG